MFGVLFDLYLLSSGHRPGAACHANGCGQNTVIGKRHSSRPSESFNLFCMLQKKEKKSLFCLRVNIFYNCTAFKGWEVEKYPKIGCRFLQLCLC